MHTIVWYVFTVGIPLLGVVLCIFGGKVCFHRTRAQRVRCVSAALGYLVLTLVPFGLAWLAIAYGRYLARSQEIYTFFGEETWALVAAMLCYFCLATVSNLALWLLLASIKGQPVETESA